VPRVKQKPITVTLTITGLRQTLAAFRDLPKEAATQLRDASARIADHVAAAAKAAGSASSPRSRLVAQTVRVVRDRVPAVQVGGTKQVGHRKTPVWKLLFGDEFGASTYPQFRPHRGREGYWFFPTVEAEQPTIDREWNKAADDIVRWFSSAREGS
jgi:hypothetical protein